jgi:hypothetical protein
MNLRPIKPSAVKRIAARIAKDENALGIPRVKSFREFLERYAVAKGPQGFAPFSFKGREGLGVAVDIIDYILGNPIDTDVELPHLPGVSVEDLRRERKPIKDAKVSICGGAQIGKTILELWFKVYMLAIKKLAVGLYLPDDDLVQGVIDGKLRPEVIDQAPWFARMITVGKTLNESGKAVNRKGAFLVTDGKFSALAMMRGMAKFPTTFTMDAQVIDERDDIPEGKAKFLVGRMTAGSLRFTLTIGTQRVHGAGQNKEFNEGTQHIGHLTCACCSEKVNPDAAWPGICRVAMDGKPSVEDPKLTLAGDFKRDDAGETVATYDPAAPYYFACPTCGTELDREAVVFTAQRPERAKINWYSVRVAQTTSSAIELVQLVADWCLRAVVDPDSMAAFYCDRVGIPRNTTQQLDAAILERARSLESFQLSLVPREGVTRFGGLDTGDRCWFSCREIESDLVKRITWLEQLPTGSVRARVPALFHTLGLSALFVDIGAERDLARDLCFILNGLVDFEFPKVPEPEKAYISFPGGLAWDGPSGKWRGLKCAAVEFSLKDGQGIRHKLGVTQDRKMYPVIQCNRDETLSRFVNELLTADEGVIQPVEIDGRRVLRTQPILRLPARGLGSPKVLETFDAHLITGSQKAEDNKGDLHYVDGVENHFFLSCGYGALAETVGGQTKLGPFAFTPAEITRDGVSEDAFGGRAALL